MSDDSDETIDAGPDVLAHLKAEAERRSGTPSASPAAPRPAAPFDDDEDVTVYRATAHAPVEPTRREPATLEPTPAPSTPPSSGPAPSAPPPGATGSTAAGAAGGESAATQFVREFREREAAPAEEPVSPSRSRRSGIWILLGIFVGAQILAVGVYFSITALRDDPDIVDLEVAEDDPDGANPGDAAADSSADGADAGDTDADAAEPTAFVVEPTATAVPPTPTWRPVDGGPRTAPFTFLVEAIVTDPQFFDDADGQPLEPSIDGRALPLRNPTASGVPLVLRVAGGEPGDEWLQVELPGADEIVWVRGEEFAWDSTTHLIQIDITTNTLVVFNENQAIFSAPVASGTRSSPTPRVTTYVIEEVGSLGEDVPRRIRLANFAGRAASSDGLGSLAIGIAEDPAAFRTEAGYVTAGSILLARNDYAQLADLTAAGDRVEIIGIPTPPTPTPVPPPTPSIDRTRPGSGSGGFVGCPPATFGLPPNCYRVVERLTVAGECTGSGILIEDTCYLLGGDPDRLAGSCTSNAPTLIGGLCYLQVGPRPEIDGGCPAEATEVRGECRVPV